MFKAIAESFEEASRSRQRGMQPPKEEQKSFDEESEETQTVEKAHKSPASEEES